MWLCCSTTSTLCLSPTASVRSPKQLRPTPTGRCAAWCVQPFLWKCEAQAAGELATYEECEAIANRMKRHLGMCHQRGEHQLPVEVVTAWTNQHADFWACWTLWSERRPEEEATCRMAASSSPRRRGLVDPPRGCLSSDGTRMLHASGNLRWPRLPASSPNSAFSPIQYSSAQDGPSPRNSSALEDCVGCFGNTHGAAVARAPLRRVRRERRATWCEAFLTQIGRAHV